MQVASISMEEEGSQVRITFELANTDTKKLYDFVKLFIGQEYIGLKYLDIPGGKTRPVEFRFDPTAISGAPDMILTAADRDDGVLFQEPLRDVSDEDILDTDAIKKQAERLAETEISDATWERLEDEYLDLVQDEASRKQQVMERLRKEYETLREEKRETATDEPFSEKAAGDKAKERGQDNEQEKESRQPEPPEEAQQDEDEEEIEVHTLDDNEDEEPSETQSEQKHQPEEAPEPDIDLDAEPEPPVEHKKPTESPERHGDVGKAVKKHDQAPEPESNLLQSVVGSVFGSGKTENQPEEEDQANDEEASEEPEETDVEEDEREGDDLTLDADEHEVLPSERVKRRSTGIKGLDGKMQGGLVDGTMNLVTGKTGTGKTAFCANFLRRGAELGEPGVYVTTEEREEDIKADIESMFGWNFGEMEEEGKVKILSIKPVFPSKEIENLNRLVRSYISNLLDQVMEAVEEIEAERVIIDSVSIIEMFIRDEYMARVALASLLNKLREAKVTALMTGTVPETSEGLSGGGIIEFLVDTVLLLEFVPVAEEFSRTLTIRKMRRTDHEVEIFPFEITPQGIQLHEVE